MGKENQGNSVNLLCEGTLIVGDIKTKNDIRIDGVVTGNITTSGRLLIGNSSKIEGNIICVNIDIHGTVIGDIVASGTVSLKSPSKVIGNISYAVLSIEPGSVFNGSSKILNKEGSK